MEILSVFDMLKIGVGPSSSHTLGPWRAIQRWLSEGIPSGCERIEIELYGSLALTGKGHCTDIAICLALLGEDPETVDIDGIESQLEALKLAPSIRLTSKISVPFDRQKNIVFSGEKALPEHANAMACRSFVGRRRHESVYFSVGGGFVVARDQAAIVAPKIQLPYPCQLAEHLLSHCDAHNLRICDMVRANEHAWRDEAEVRQQLGKIWKVMKAGMFRGSHQDGWLPGGLQVKRRAGRICRKLLDDAPQARDDDEWLEQIRSRQFHTNQIMQWLSCFAMAVNEENACLGRVVTAPTNGAAGVIPAVLMYQLCFGEKPMGQTDIENFLLVSGEIATYFKKGATISAAMGGCQAEIGVSSSMAAAALTEAQGGSVRQAVMAAEIAMEHHLGMTCDPIAGLVQIPCIERNAMGAIKAIQAAQLALASDPADAKISLDNVIKTMATTAKDMNSKYKETSRGGLATNVPVALSEC
ncbi:MAG: L-serine ammonia-lyase [Oceanococcus sp.]